MQDWRFTANFKYTVKDSVPLAQRKSLKSFDYGKFDSECTQTMVGFYQTQDDELHCAYAVQTHAAINSIVIDEDANGAFIEPVASQTVTKRWSNHKTILSQNVI